MLGASCPPSRTLSLGRVGGSAPSARPSEVSARMGAAPLRQCGAARCSELVRGASYCAAHRGSRWAAQDDRRGTSRERGYTSDWDRLSTRVRQEEPFCRLCLAAGRVRATVLVDHIVAKVDGGTDDLANLQGLCRPCHGTKTAEEVARRAR